MLLLALLVLELILQQQALLRSEESNTYEPLLSSMGRDEEQAAQQAGRRPKENLGRMAIALQSFRYVWPKTSECWCRGTRAGVAATAAPHHMLRDDTECHRMPTSL